MSVSACDAKISIMFSLLLDNIRILSCFFFLFLVMFSNFLIINVAKTKIIVKLGPAIPIGAPTTLAEQIIENPPLLAIKTIKALSV